jgi:hypothetical protein
MPAEPTPLRPLARTPRLLAAAALALCLAGAAPAQTAARPRLEIADPARACPAIAGSFVAVLDADRGMLLLSGGDFLGGRPLGRAAGENVRLAVPGGAPWTLARAVSAAGRVEIWGAVYPFTDQHTTGCVAFDRDRFSSEGDLVTYLRWVVDGVYLAIPADERRLHPALRVSNREVRLRVEGLGFQPLPLAGKESATMTFRLPGVDRTYLVTPFVLDEETARIAVQVASTAEAFWVGAEKQALGWVVASPAKPGTLAEPPLTIAVVGIAPASGAATAP